METVERSHQCQALRYEEGDQCPNRITHTVTSGEWMEVMPWHLGEDYDGMPLDFEDIVTVDARQFDAASGSELVAGDMIFINVVHRAWCGECVADEKKVTHWTTWPRFTELKPGDAIPNGTSRYCVAGYNEDACDYSCGPDDHEFRAAHTSRQFPALSSLLRLG